MMDFWSSTTPKNNDCCPLEELKNSNESTCEITETGVTPESARLKDRISELEHQVEAVHLMSQVIHQMVGHESRWNNCSK